MTDTLVPSQRPNHRHRGYLLAGLAMTVVVLGGYISWHHRAAPNAAALANLQHQAVEEFLQLLDPKLFP